MTWWQSLQNLLHRDRPAGPAAVPGPSRPARPADPPSRSSQQALSGYGSNPYDTYTWELHAGEGEERRLKRTTDVTRRPDDEDVTDKFNPYNSGQFKGGW